MDITSGKSAGTVGRIRVIMRMIFTAYSSLYASGFFVADFLAVVFPVVLLSAVALEDVFLDPLFFVVLFWDPLLPTDSFPLLFVVFSVLP